jgi:HEAT repeat protein
VAISVLKESSEELLKALIKLVNQEESADVSRMALWALRVHHPRGLERLAREIIAKTHDAALCNETIQVLGVNPTEDDLKTFFAMYNSTVPRNTRVPPSLYRAVVRFSPRQFGSRLGRGYTVAGLRTAPAVALDQANGPTTPRVAVVARRRLRHSYEFVNKRKDETYRTDSMWHVRRIDSKGSFELRFGLIALGRLGEEEDVALLIDVLKGKHVSTSERDERKYDPSRTFAALGLGLHLRGRENPGVVLKERPGKHGRKAARVLGRLGQDEREPANLWAACALALSLSGDREQIGNLKQMLGSVKGGDGFVTASAALALSLLGDETALSVAGAMLPDPVDEINVENVRALAFREKSRVTDTLKLRAVIFGLGCLGNTDGVGLLRAQFGRDQYTSMDLIRSLKWCEADDIRSVLEQSLSDPDVDEATAILSASSLGKLYDPNEAPRLHAAILKNCNLTLPAISGHFTVRVKNSAVYRYRCYTNEFLFKVLIPMTQRY